MFSRTKAKNKKQARIEEAKKRSERAESFQSLAFYDLKMLMCNHSLLTPILRKRVANVVGLTTDGITFYSTSHQKKGVVIRGQVIYKKCRLGEAVYYVEGTEEVEDGIYKTNASLLPIATEALESTIGQGTLDRLAFMLGDTTHHAA